MSIKITFKTGSNDRSIKNYVLFSDEEFKINGLGRLSISKSSNQISKLIISNKSKKKDFISFNLNSDQKIILIKIKNKLTATDNEKKGANFYNYLKSNLIFDATFLNNNITTTQSKNSTFFDEFLHGMQLKSYNFNKYKTKQEIQNIDITILNSKKIKNKKRFDRFSSILEGTNYTKDLVSEPGNILHPDEYAKRLLKLKNIVFPL